jgi:Protein of unknown function (DUF4007)
MGVTVVRRGCASGWRAPAKGCGPSMGRSLFILGAGFSDGWAASSSAALGEPAKPCESGGADDWASGGKNTFAQGGSRLGSHRQMKFSGHETFPCRYAWLPKAAEAVNENPELFGDEADAMVRLGLGKNMVRALKFWVQVTGIAAPEGRGSRALALTDLGRSIFIGRKGRSVLDPFLEDIKTLWLLHWQISTCSEHLLAWDFLLFERPTAEFTKSEVVSTLLQKAQDVSRKATAVTIAQHFDVFLHTYVPTSARKGEVQEDNLDSPLTELNLLGRCGERRGEGGRRETIYAFSGDGKPEISDQLFYYCLDAFWTRHHSDEKTLPLRQIQIGRGGPGLAFRLPEEDVRERVRRIAKDSGGALEFQESLVLNQVIRARPDSRDLLAEIYAS